MEIRSPVLSHTLFKEIIAPLIDKDPGPFLVVIDNLRYDQWKGFEPIINEYYKSMEEKFIFQYPSDGNSICAKCYFFRIDALDMEKKFPNIGRMIPMKGVKTYMKMNFSPSSSKD